MADAVVNWIEAPQFGKAYHIAEEIMTIEGARIYCESLGGKVLLPESQEESNFVCGNLRQVLSVWLDVKEGCYVGISKRFDGKLIAYDNWGENKYGNAAVLWIDNGSFRGFWSAFLVTPLSKHHVICERYIKASSHYNDEMDNTLNNNVMLRKIDSRLNSLEAKFEQMMTLMTEAISGVNEIKAQLAASEKANDSNLLFETL